MQVTSVKVFPVRIGGKLKAKANVNLVFEGGEEISIKGLRIHEGEKGPWIGMPSEKYERDGKIEYSEMIWTNEQFRVRLFPIVLAEYKKQVK